MSDKPIIPASNDFIYIDLIKSDLFEIVESDADRARPDFDSECQNKIGRSSKEDKRPIGKQVK